MKNITLRNILDKWKKDAAVERLRMTYSLMNLAKTYKEISQKMDDSDLE